ncbi:hypothetical protein QFC24_005491 [Naganishia onofrii]|uniref:Uncharacterized protein n=1 Tax=Naganishia onofrii TaxID=1851511 RepID=A0ACC2X857_9TREE|nr:hypothetical protein QFC24_005491 [Naganishia onofrii]
MLWKEEEEKAEEGGSSDNQGDDEGQAAWDQASTTGTEVAVDEDTVSTTIFFETLYHALLKPPQTLQVAHPDNYICARERRKLALEEEMERRGLLEQDKEALRKKWAEEETANLKERRRKVGLNSFTKLKVIGHVTLTSAALPWTRVPQSFPRGKVYLRDERTQQRLIGPTFLQEDPHALLESPLIGSAASLEDAVLIQSLRQSGACFDMTVCTI